MTDGLITRVGKWLDNKWESKATCRELEEVKAVCAARDYQVHQAFEEVKRALQALDLSDLKTRLEKIELYSGMTRKVDPTKPAVVKSAFSM